MHYVFKKTAQKFAQICFLISAFEIKIAVKVVYTRSARLCCSVIFVTCQNLLKNTVKMAICSRVQWQSQKNLVQGWTMEGLLNKILRP